MSLEAGARIGKERTQAVPKRFRLRIRSKAYLYLILAILILTGVGIWAALDLALDMVRYTAFLSVAAVLILLPLLIWLVEPLRDLERAADLLDAGDLHTPLPVTQHVELRRLATSFEGLRGRILDGLHQKERLLVDVSHEMKGPLARIRLAVDLLEDQHGKDPMLSQIKDEVMRLSGLLSELLDRARMEQAAIAQEPLDLAALTAALIQLRVQVAQAAGIRVETDLQAAPVLGDRALLERAIGNLLDNALTYARPGDRVMASTRQEGATVICQITDNGPGIPEGDLPHIFEPFYRPDVSRTRDTGGAGLGLSLVRSAVEAHGGRIQLNSREGEGTDAEIRLPARQRVH